MQHRGGRRLGFLIPHSAGRHFASVILPASLFDVPRMEPPHSGNFDQSQRPCANTTVPVFSLGSPGAPQPSTPQKIRPRPWLSSNNPNRAGIRNFPGSQA
jgi:hypothetical protein